MVLSSIENGNLGFRNKQYSEFSIMKVIQKVHMINYNKSHSVMFDSLLQSELKKLSQALDINRAAKKSLILFLGLGLLSGVKAEVAQDHGLSLLKPSIDKNEDVKINLHENLLSIDAKQVPWQKLLAKLKEKTQISIQTAKPIESIVTVSIPALPVTEALQQLFIHRFDSVFLLSEQKADNSAIPKAVWLFGDAKDNSARTNLSEAKYANNKTGKNSFATAGSNIPVKEYIDDATIMAVVDKARNSENPEARVEALASLSGQGQPDENSVKLALETALVDTDARVREYAVQALANQNGQDAVVYMRDALGDPDAGVRMKAVESIVLEGQGITLLQEALNNPDELVRAIAEERLKQINP
jgi:hypothetical protein